LYFFRRAAFFGFSAEIEPARPCFVVYTWCGLRLLAAEPPPRTGGVLLATEYRMSRFGKWVRLSAGLQWSKTLRVKSRAGWRGLDSQRKFFRSLVLGQLLKFDGFV
jgi:hypothetical protein